MSKLFKQALEALINHQSKELRQRGGVYYKNIYKKIINKNNNHTYIQLQEDWTGDELDPVFTNISIKIETTEKESIDKLINDFYFIEIKNWRCRESNGVFTARFDLRLYCNTEDIYSVYINTIINKLKVKNQVNLIMDLL